jgi:two-component system nitrogen regulation response regulator GlnG
MPTILIVDDDDAIRAILYEVLSEKYECHTASTADEALQYLEVEDYDAILTDLKMPGLDGVSLLKQVQLRDLDTPVIFISGKSGEADSARVIELGAFAYLTKPFQLDEVEKTIERAVTRNRPTEPPGKF